MKDTLITLATGTKIEPVGGGGDTLKTDVTNIINIIIGVLGVVAVVVIILGGVQYMTSSGDAGKVKKAKDTILYGVIGLVIVALAFAIVNFVISGVLGNQSSSTCHYIDPTTNTSVETPCSNCTSNGGTLNCI